MARHEQPPAPRRERIRVPLAFLWHVLPGVWAFTWGLLAFSALIVFLDGVTPGTPEAKGGLYGAIFCAAMASPGGLVLLLRRRAEPDEPALTYTRPDLTSIPPARVRPEQRHRLPRPGSAARQPVRHLAKAESALAELLRQLKDSAVPADVVDDAWRTATDTAAGLRAAASRLEAVEIAAEQLLPPERAALEDGMRDLLTHIEQGLDAYRGLISAAGRVLLASAPTPAGDELAEETERLAAIAEALRELSSPADMS